MNKDDQEFFAAIKKGTRLPLIVSEFNDKNSSSKTSYRVIDNLLRNDNKHWKMFYPTNNKKILLPMKLEDKDKIFYATEMDIDILLDLEISEVSIEKTLDGILNRARKEVKWILAEEETYYYIELLDKKDKNYYGNCLEFTTKLMREDNKSPRMKIASVIYNLNGTDWLIVGKDRAHLARTTIFIANTYQ